MIKVVAVAVLWWMGKHHLLPKPLVQGVPARIIRTRNGFGSQANAKRSSSVVDDEREDGIRARDLAALSQQEMC